MKKTIQLETLYTPYTLDTYSTFTDDDSIDQILDQEGKEYDDFEWEYNKQDRLRDLTKNLVALLNENIIDNVIKSIAVDGDPVSPRQYNFETDKAWLNFEIDGQALDQYINDHKEDYEKNKIKDRAGFWWFGGEDQTRLNYYLKTKTAQDYEPEAYYCDQIETIDAYEYIDYTPITK